MEICRSPDRRAAADQVGARDERRHGGRHFFAGGNTEAALPTRAAVRQKPSLRHRHQTTIGLDRSLQTGEGM